MNLSLFFKYPIMVRSVFLLYSILATAAPLIAQERIESVEHAFRLLGANVAVINNYLKSQDFAYSSSSNHISDYSKATSWGSVSFTISAPNDVVEVLSWTENILYYPVLIKELNELGFVQKQKTGNGIIGFHKPTENKMVTLILRQQMKEVVITIGKENNSKRLKRNTPLKPSIGLLDGKSFSTTWYCDEFWKFQVTIDGSRIKIRSFKRDSQVAEETEVGIIREGSIVIKSGEKYIKDLYKLSSDKLYQLNYENSYNQYERCRSSSEKNLQKEVEETGSETLIQKVLSPQVQLLMDKREFIDLPRVESGATIKGKVVVQIEVDAEGKIVYTRPGAAGTTISDSDLWVSCEKALKSSKVNAANGTPVQLGKVIFQF